jgi:hypothetical protein
MVDAGRIWTADEAVRRAPELNASTAMAGGAAA